MKKKNVVISTLSEDVFTDAVDKIEEMGARVIEKRYDLLYHRYEIYAKLNLRQSYILRKFMKSREATIMEFGA